MMLAQLIPRTGFAIILPASFAIAPALVFAQPRVDPDQPHTRLEPPTALLSNEPYILEQGQERNSDLSIADRNVEIRGALHGNLLVIRGRVEVLDGGVVDGDVILVGEEEAVQESGGHINGRILKFPAPEGFYGPIRGETPEPPRTAPARPHRSTLPFHRHGGGYGDWVGSQLFFAVCGIIAALLALVVAPRASTMAVAAIESEPMRCLIVGLIGLTALGAVTVANFALCYTVVWLPAGIFVFMAEGLVMLYAGILGVAFLGGRLARRLGWSTPGFVGRAGLGLIALAIINSIPLINIASLTLEAGAFVLGLGGLIVTGLGSDPAWLSARLASLSHDPQRG